jgi:hypothetical protein
MPLPLLEPVAEGVEVASVGFVRPDQIRRTARSSCMHAVLVVVQKPPFDSNQASRSKEQVIGKVPASAATAVTLADCYRASTRSNCHYPRRWEARMK